MRFKDKVCVLTGGCSDMGIAVAEKFLKEGAKVVLVDISEELFEKMDEYKAEYGDNYRFFLGSVCNYDEMEKAMEFTAKEFGTVDILVNMAGMGGRGKIEEMTLESWNNAIAVTLTGTYHACRAAVPYMKEKNYGRIINVSSIGGRSNRPVNVAYAASKAGVNGFSRGLAIELAPWNITVNTVAPGPLNGGMFTKGAKDPNYVPSPEMIKARQMLESTVAMGRLGEMSEIANGILYLADDEAGWTTGEILDINGGALMI